MLFATLLEFFNHLRHYNRNRNLLTKETMVLDNSTGNFNINFTEQMILIVYKLLQRSRYNEHSLCCVITLQLDSETPHNLYEDRKLQTNLIYAHTFKNPKQNIKNLNPHCTQTTQSSIQSLPTMQMCGICDPHIYEV